MAGFNFGTPSTTSTPGGLFGSGTASSTPFSFGSPAPKAASTGPSTGFTFGTSTPASTGAATGFSLGSTAPTGTTPGFGNPASTGGTPGFSLGNTASTGGTPGFSLGSTSTAAPGAAPAATSTAVGFSFAKPTGTGAVGTTGFTCFGATAGMTPASTTPGLALGAAKTTAPTGFALGTQATPASTGFSLGTTPATGSLPNPGGALVGLLGAKPPASSTQTAGTPLLASLTQTSVGGVPAQPTLGGATTTGSLFSAKQPATAQATTGVGLNLGAGGLKLGVPTATAPGTTGTAASGVAPIVGFGTSATTSAPASGFGVSTASTASTGSLGFAPALSTATSKPTTTTTGPVASQQMNYKQLEEQINKWMTELEEQERQFLLQATQVNAWDRLLVDNGEKITQLNGDKERVKVDQNKLEQELDFIKAQQRELEELLIPMEKSLEQLPSPSFQQHADLERENTYQLAYNIDAQLKRMVQDLKEIIDHLNTSNSTQDTNDPILQITMILNAHMDSLQWIDTSSALLGRRVEDISKQMESQRKDQERNFRLVYD